MASKPLKSRRTSADLETQRLPRNVRRFAWLWLASNLAVFAELLLLPPLDPVDTPPGLTRPIEIAAITIAVTVLFALQLPFFWLAVWRRRNWAKWVLLASFGLALSLLFLDDHMFRPDHLPLAVTALLGTAVEAVAFYFAFTGDAPAWFKPGKST